MSSKPVKKPSARKSLCLFINILEVNPKTAKRRFVAAKSKLKSMKVCNSLWTKTTKRKGHSKINEQIKRNLYTWITRHPQFVQSPISMIVSKLCYMIRQNLHLFQNCYFRYLLENYIIALSKYGLPGDF